MKRLRSIKFNKIINNFDLFINIDKNAFRTVKACRSWLLITKKPN